MKLQNLTIEHLLVGLMSLPFIWIIGMFFLSLYPSQKLTAVSICGIVYGMFKIFKGR